MGAVNTTYTFTATDTITSTKMNNIIDETVMTADAVLGGSGGSGGLDIASGKLSISANAINNSRLATNSVTSANIVDGTIVNADINASAAIDGTKISPNFGAQAITTTGDAVTGTLYLSRQNADIEGGEVQFRKAFDATTAFTIDCNGAGHSPNLRIFGTTGQVATITASGNVGIGTDSPNAKLQVAGGVIRVEASGGEGGHIELLSVDNSTVTGVLDVGSTNITRLLSLTNTPVVIGANSAEVIRVVSGGNVGIGTTTPSSKLQVNGTVTATEFSGPLTGNASSASTVSNSAITAAKLDGNQSGTAPIYGVRAWASIDIAPTRSLFAVANINSATRIDSTHTQIGFAEWMSDTSYVVSGCPQNDATLEFSTYDHQTNGFKIRHSTENAGRRVQFMVIR